MAPRAVQVATLQKDHNPDARTIMNCVPLYIEHQTTGFCHNQLLPQIFLTPANHELHKLHELKTQINLGL
jgi:hypothetical protein